MIELIAERLREVLIAYLPVEINYMNNFWNDSDISKYGHSLSIIPPRNDSGGSNYFIGLQQKMIDFPTIVIEPVSEVFDRSINVSKTGFQFEDYSLNIYIFYRRGKTERLDILAKCITRITDSVINTIRKYPNLRDVNSDSNAITNAVGINGVNYYAPGYNEGIGFFRASEINVSYRATDALRTSVYYT